MITRKMNVRISIYRKINTQNEDGEVLERQRRNIYNVWTEVSKTTVRDFKQKSKTKESMDGLSNNKDTKVFLIRYIPNAEIDNTMFIEFAEQEYQIEDVSIDYASKDIIMLKGVRIS